MYTIYFCFALYCSLAFKALFIPQCFLTACSKNQRLVLLTRYRVIWCTFTVRSEEVVCSALHELALSATARASLTTRSTTHIAESRLFISTGLELDSVES